MSHFHVYRIVKRKWAGSAFDGEGARLFGGRWNSKGNPCVYTAGSESLALLEMLVHLNSGDILNQYCMIKISLPEDDVMYLPSLPDGWQAEPAPPETARIGDEWIKSRQSLALRVPSVVVPRESNYLINPAHENIDKLLETAEAIAFDIDPRLV